MGDLGFDCSQSGSKRGEAVLGLPTGKTSRKQPCPGGDYDFPWLNYLTQKNSFHSVVRL